MDDCLSGSGIELIVMYVLTTNVASTSLELSTYYEVSFVLATHHCTARYVLILCLGQQGHILDYVELECMYYNMQSCVRLLAYLGCVAIARPPEPDSVLKIR